MRESGRHEVLAGLIDLVGRAIGLLGDELDDLLMAGAARSVLLDLGRRLDPAVLLPEASAGESAVIVQLRPLVVDLLVASGMTSEDALAVLPSL